MHIYGASSSAFDAFAFVVVRSQARACERLAQGRGFESGLQHALFIFAPFVENWHGLWAFEVAP
jgi:hypothetical protein